MRKKWKFRRSAGRSDEGFTLIELLVTLSVTSISVLLFSAALTQLITLRNHTHDDRQIEWHLFLNQLEYDMKDNVLRDVVANRIRMWEVTDGVVQSDVIAYNLNTNKRYVRTRNGTGQQLMLLKIESMSLKRDGNRIDIHVTFQNGEAYSGRIKVMENT
ncbi:competence type IV pilus minor pilin ComGF [Alkalibacterium psychrotolerans]